MQTNKNHKQNSISLKEQMMKMGALSFSPELASFGLIGVVWPQISQELMHREKQEQYDEEDQTLYSEEEQENDEDIEAKQEYQFANRVRYRKIRLLPIMLFKELKKTQNSSFESTCSICLCAISSQRRIRILPCLHYFHRHCIDRQLGQRSCCPYCKAEVSLPKSVKSQ